MEKHLSIANGIANRMFGYPRLRDVQAQVIDSVTKGKDVLHVAPTGSGKSAPWQILSLLRKGVTLVFSPLIALMKDQVDFLRTHGVKAARITHDLSPHSQDKILKRLPRYDIVYVAPERLKNLAFRRAIKKSKVATIIVDEAHILYKWGLDFRPSYAGIGEFRDSLKHSVPVVACTATADYFVEKHVAKVLGMSGYTRLVAPPDRPNLHFTSTRDITERSVAHFVEDAVDQDGVAIVYCSTRKATESLAARMRSYKLEARHYHGGMEGDERTEVQDEFMGGDLNVVVATNAFGLGIDKPNVRAVIHWHMPPTVFDYVQEAGRAGRDGAPAECCLNVSGEGKRLQSFFSMLRNPEWYIYDYLWDWVSRLKVGKSAKTSITALGKIGHTNPKFPDRALTALNFMEFNGGVKVQPGVKVYELPIVNRELVMEYADEFPGFSFPRKGVVRIIVTPDIPNSVDDMIQDKAVRYVPPREELRVKRTGIRCPVTQADVEDKKERDRVGMEQLLAFATAQDKTAYIRRVFL